MSQPIVAVGVDPAKRLPVTALCHNGKMLKQPAPGGRWRFTILRTEEIAGDPAGRRETTTVASAGITRTTRDAWRKLANDD